MRKIHLVDLQTQYEKIQEEVDAAVLNVVRSTAYINGPEVKSFQAELEDYLSVKHVIPCANGTDALQIALMGMGLKPGDEVITPSFTYVATAEVIALLNLTPVFVEVRTDTFTIEPEAFRAAITDKTKAVIPVHLYGQCAEMDEIMAIAKEHNIGVVEDTAQALGSDYRSADGTVKKAGTIGHIGCTSFFPSKNLGCYGDGGAIFTNDDELAANIRMLANHGQSKRYYHDHIGVNSRLDSIQAAILRIKLRQLNDYIVARNAVADHYDSQFDPLPQLTVPARCDWSNHGFHQYTLKLSGVDREALQQFLQERGIPSNIYYPVPIHRQKAYEDSANQRFDLSTTENLCELVFSLPMHTEMDEEQLKHITDSVIEFINQ